MGRVRALRSADGALRVSAIGGRAAGGAGGVYRRGEARASGGGCILVLSLALPTCIMPGCVHCCILWPLSRVQICGAGACCPWT